MAGLSKKDLGALVALLSDDTKPIESVGALFHRTFAKADHFRVATALWYERSQLAGEGVGMNACACERQRHDSRRYTPFCSISYSMKLIEKKMLRILF